MNINKAIREATGIDRDDFDSDLNAMHEAEKVLTIAQRGGYLMKLAEVCGCGFGERDYITTTCTAAQRSEAFLKTLNLWEETK